MFNTTIGQTRRPHVAILQFCTLALLWVGYQPTDCAFAQDGEWKKLTDKAGKFSVLFPGSPKRTERQIPTTLGNIKVVMYIQDLPTQSKAYLVGFNDYPENKLYGQKEFDYKVLAGVAGGVSRSRKAKVVRKTQIKIGKYHGLEILLSINNDQRFCLFRAYLVKNRLYQVFADYPGKPAKATADAQKFLNSFQLTK